MQRKSIIISISSHKLNSAEESLIKNQKPWGIILFERNIKSISQLKNLTTRIRYIMKDPYYPILIDEEGGRVSRLKKFIDNSIFSAEYFGNLFNKDKKKFNIYT